MGGTYANLLCHIVFSTKERRQLLTATIEYEVYAYFGGVFRHQGAELLAGNGDYDHVHLLARLKPTHRISDLVRDLKANSSGSLNERVSMHKFFWQNGYAVFSVSALQVNRGVSYIEGQKQHHRKQSYSDELLAMLKRHGVDYDPALIWR